MQFFFQILSKLGVFGTLYCVTWRSKNGDVVDLKPNHPFCLLSGKLEEQLQRRKAWITTVKIVYGQSYPVHRNTCLCSQHVVNCNGKAKDSVPDHMVLTRSTPMKRSLELQTHPEVRTSYHMEFFGECLCTRCVGACAKRAHRTCYL